MVVVVVVIVVIVVISVVVVVGVLVKTIPKIIAVVFQVVKIVVVAVYVVSSIVVVVVVMLDVLIENVTKVPITPFIIHLFQPSNSVDEKFSLAHGKVQFPQVAFFKQHQYRYRVHLEDIKGRTNSGKFLLSGSK